MHAQRVNVDSDQAHSDLETMAQHRNRADRVFLNSLLFMDGHQVNNSVLKYRSPVLGRMVTMRLPAFSARAAT